MDSDRAAVNVPEIKDRQQASEKVALLVLGMHRSGTSALARVLNLLGCSLPHQVMDGNLTNPTGHWEPQAIVELNDEILEAAGSAWNDWQQLNPGWEKSPARAGFMRKAARTLQSEYDDSSFFVVKDPRICRIAPFWLDVLRTNSIDPRIIIPVRNPLEVAASLHRRDGMDPSLGYLIWLRHILDAERGTRGVKRIFTTYSQLLDNWTKVTAHIADGLDISWPRYSPRVVGEIDNFLDKRLRNHHRNDRDTLTGSPVPGWVRQAYDIVLRWSEGAEAPDDFADLDAISKALDEAALSFGTPMTLFQQATVHLQDARGHVIAADRDRDAAIDRADAAERLLHERGEEIERLASRLRDAEGQCEAAEQLLRERGDELAIVEADLKAAEIRNSELQIELDSAHELGLSVEQALIQRRREHDEAVGKLAEAGSELLQRKEELRQVWAELDAEKERAEALEASLKDGSDTLQSMERQLSDACDNNALLKAERERNKQELARWQELVKREQEQERERLHTLEEAQKELANVRSALEASKKSLEQAKNDGAESKARLEAVEAELEKTHAVARSAVSQRSQTFNEIAIVTQLLRDSEHDVQNRDETVQWLSQVYAIMLRRPRWWIFLSRKAQFKRLSKRVEQRGMFDPRAYLAKNPDVAATGADPLRHYITHGIQESRPR